jgi:hypothetical protein
MELGTDLGHTHPLPSVEASTFLAPEENEISPSVCARDLQSDTLVKLDRENEVLTPVGTRVLRMSVPSMIFCSILILFVLYGDGLAILSEFPILTDNSVMKYVETDKDSSVVVGDFKLSLPKLAFIFFNGGGVFNRVPDNNIEYALYGRHLGADPTQPWEDLNFLKNCFPYDCRGEIYTRMEFPWHSVLGPAAHATAMNNLLVKIKNKYNREHPQNPLDKIAIYMLWWPWSEDGFYKLKQPDTTHWQLLGEQ